LLIRANANQASVIGDAGERIVSLYQMWGKAAEATQWREKIQQK
jgi:hypothetical protein